MRQQSITVRFWQRVVCDLTTRCWQWTGHINQNGYGCIKSEGGRAGKSLRVHRVSYELLVGPLPADMVIDHLCRNRACCNPAHMELVTFRENVLRGYGSPAQNARKTTCSNGHEFTPENTYLRPEGGRACRTCMHDRQQRFLARKAAYDKAMRA